MVSVIGIEFTYDELVILIEDELIEFLELTLNKWNKRYSYLKNVLDDLKYLKKEISHILENMHEPAELQLWFIEEEFPLNSSFVDELNVLRTQFNTIEILKKENIVNNLIVEYKEKIKIHIDSLINYFINEKIYKEPINLVNLFTSSIEDQIIYCYFYVSEKSFIVGIENKYSEKSQEYNSADSTFEFKDSRQLIENKINRFEYFVSFIFLDSTIPINSQKEIKQFFIKQ